MHFLGWFILFFAVVRLLVAIINWASNMYLPKNPILTNQPFVSILIPARNEEKNIANLLSDLSNLNYKKHEIIVYNDNSTDKTASIIDEYSALNQNIKRINGNEPEKGWLGKNFACHQLALKAKGEVLLFLDADVRVGNGLIEKSLAYQQKHNLKLLSIFPKQLMNNLGAEMSVPIMNWILLSLLPLFLVRWSSWTSFSAANGQFMLFDTVIYKQLLPHNHFKGNKVEDIAIIKYYKSKKLPIATLLGDDNISCSMYSNLKEAIEGFSKNVFQFFGGSVIVTFTFALLTTFAPFFVIIFLDYWFLIPYLFIVILLRIFVSLASKQSVIRNLLLIVPQNTVFLFIIYRAYIHKRNNKFVWKNREIISE